MEENKIAKQDSNSRHGHMASFTAEKPLTEADLPATAARGRFKGKVAIVTGGASGKLHLCQSLT